MNGRAIILFFILALTGGCVVEFIPDVDKGKEYINVEGLITNQNRSYQVKVSKVSGIGIQNTIRPVNGAIVTVTDDLGNINQFVEKNSGLYVSDSLIFIGQTGRTYSLHITSDGILYESEIMEMRPVPEIDSLYAELEYNPSYSLGDPVPGYRVYLNTGDPSGQCRFYRWNYEETWEFRIPYVSPTIINKICWKNASSDKIYLKDVSALTENRITSYPFNFITTETDRLKTRYSILINQYSLNEVEYLYWDKIRKVTENVGGLYDVIPSSIRGNMYCADNPGEKVLGYFSVSSVTSKRLFIESKFINFPDFYGKCPVDTVPVSRPIVGLNTFVFIIFTLTDFPPLPLSDYYVLTDKKKCIDCTLEGTNIMPPYWNQPKKQTIINDLYKEK